MLGLSFANSKQALCCFALRARSPSDGTGADTGVGASLTTTGVTTTGAGVGATTGVTTGAGVTGAGVTARPLSLEGSLGITCSRYITLQVETFTPVNFPRVPLSGSKPAEYDKLLEQSSKASSGFRHVIRAEFILVGPKRKKAFLGWARKGFRFRKLPASQPMPKDPAKIG